MEHIYKKRWFWITTLIIIAVLAYAKLQNAGTTSVVNKSKVAATDYKNASYEIDGIKVQLKDGVANYTAADDSAPKATVRYFGNEARGDFNNDGLQDVAFIITQDNGGSGTFYYIVAALNNGNGYDGTNGVFLGDRIAPQTTEFRNNEIVANYADRKAGEPMTARPSVGVSKYLNIENKKLVEVVK